MYGYIVKHEYMGESLADHRNYLVQLGVMHYVLPAVAEILEKRKEARSQTNSIIYFEDDVVPLVTFREVTEIIKVREISFGLGGRKKYQDVNNAIVGMPVLYC